jgi:hypothetical protein
MTKTKSAPKKAAPKKAAQVNAGTQAYTDWVMDYIGLAKPMEPTRIDLILQGVNSISERLALLEQNAPSAAETLKAELRSISDRIDALRMEQYAISGAKKVPKFGDRVMCNGQEWKVGCDQPSDAGHWRLCPSKADYYTSRLAKRSEFTLID